MVNRVILKGTVFCLIIPNLSVSDLQLDKTAFLANFNISTPVAFFTLDFVA